MPTGINMLRSGISGVFAALTVIQNSGNAASGLFFEERLRRYWMGRSGTDALYRQMAGR